MGRTESGRHEVAVALLAAGGALALPAAAAANIIRCAEAPSGYVVYLNEPQTTPAAFADKSEVLGFLNKLQFTLDQDRDGQWVQLQNAEVRFVACAGRRPALDGQEFDKTLVETLYNQSVLLEVWGSVDAERSQGVRTSASAQINYLLVPVRFASDQHEPAPSGLLRLTYPMQGSPPTADFVQLLARPQDLDAFVAAALGYKALRERKLVPAQENLCRAAFLIGALETRITAARPRADAAKLKQFVLEAAGRAVAAAKTNDDFKNTSLRLYDVSSPCPGAGNAP